jgi:hypothetical protein
MILVIRLTSNIVAAFILILLILETVKITLTEFDFVNKSVRIIDIEHDVTALAKTRDIGYSAYKRTSTVNTGNELAVASKRLQNLRLVFLGDSVTRYQYLSLAYYLRYGYWYDTTVSPNVNNLMNAHSFHHPFHPNEDWNEFFIQSNRILHPLEICDCIRGSGTNSTYDILVERRYFYDHQYNNMLVYINMNGNETSPGRGYYGRLDPKSIFGPNFHTLIGVLPGMESYHDYDDTRHTVIWEYATWDDVIRYHVGQLNFTYNLTMESSTLPAQHKVHAIINAGLHPHDFHNPITIQNLVKALHDVQINGTWKTTTYTKEYVLRHQQNQHQQHQAHSEVDTSDNTPIEPQQLRGSNTSTSVLVSDTLMCQALHAQCLNVSWIINLQSPSLYYVDNLHFMEPIYRIMNEEYLQQILLPSSSFPYGYKFYNKSNILHPT